MKKVFKHLSIAAAAGVVMVSTGASAEQTIGVQATGTAAIATARVNVRVTVPKVIILRVGAADATISDVNFTVGVGTGVPVAPGNSQAYTPGAIPPTGGAVTVATTFPTTSAGLLNVAAWTNGTGATLGCSLAALGGATAFAAGATAAGVPGTSDILVASAGPVATNLQHPGANLTACGASTTAIASLTALGGSFTYSTAFTPAAVAAGIYGNVVTYIATAP